MKTIEFTLPDKLEMEVKKYINNGWFKNEEEMLRTALQKFIQDNKLKLAERFMKEDIEWALKQKSCDIWISKNIMSQAKKALEQIFQK